MSISFRMLLAVLFLPALALAQPPDTVWTRTFDVVGSEDDAIEVAADAHGNVYLFGQTIDTSFYNRFVIIKYSADGTMLSTRYTPCEFINDWDGGIAIDRDGNVVVAYPSHDDYHVAKYAPDADTIWTRQFDTGESEYPFDVACDRSGNIVVTGRSYNSHGDWDYLTVKYSSSGETLWTRRYDSGNSDWARSIAVDTANGIVICGVGESDGYGYLKYDSLGNLLWGHPWPGEDVYGVAIEPNGCILLAGADSNSKPTLMRTNPEGDSLWNARITGTDGCGTSVCPDDGGILVTGFVNGDMYLARYDTLGNQVWSLYGSDTLTVGNSSLCLDSAGDIVVAVTSGWYSFEDYITVIKYAMAGSIAEHRGDGAGPASLLLEQNPCRAPVAVRYRAGASSRPELSVYGADGRLVRTLARAGRPAPDRVTWDGRDEAGHIVPAGTYLLCWKAGARQGSTALVLLR
ncbi:MAG: hypothetical protein NTX53_10000 [candidate division WOR-3 bacterium]|nr:hypothetical protein [candidate division WOR-3 bacterium]